ncbi:hypothetical protein [Micromonospora taraxaci]|uniref:hypothetical protein n=1 Tax=Micromonospora taraxaci TaxID=1316803 RepID=UPI0033AF8205
MTPTASTSTEDRRLLAEVSRWRKDNGWGRDCRGVYTSADRTFGVDICDGRDGMAAGFRIMRGLLLTKPTEYPAETVREAIDMLVALNVLPARFSSAYRAGWLNGYAEVATDTMPATNPDRRCRYCGATSGLILRPGDLLTGAGRGHECIEGCKGGTR